MLLCIECDKTAEYKCEFCGLPLCKNCFLPLRACLSCIDDDNDEFQLQKLRADRIHKDNNKQISGTNGV